MRRSEIFESFVKIAQEKGLISEAEHAEHTEKDFHETNPRHDSLSIEQIGKLYGVKPDKPKDMEYKKNIMEDAHPDRVVLSPSHDKLNGLVENEIDGQNIRIHIVLKEPDGHLTQRKYARKQLLLSLVRIGNELDNRGNDELRKLADVCLEQMASDGKKKVLTKQGWVWVAAGIAAAVGLLYLQQHRTFRGSYQENYAKVQAALNKILTSNANWWGYEFTPEFVQQMTKLQADLAIIDQAAKKVIPLIMSVEKPRTKTELTQELAKIAQDPKTQEAEQAVKGFEDVLSEYTPELQAVMRNFASEGYKKQVIKDRAVATEAVDYLEIFHGGAGLFADPFDTLRQALGNYFKDLSEMEGALMQAKNIKDALQKQLEQSQASVEQMKKQPEPPAAKSEPAKPEEKKDDSPWGALEEEGQGILSGGLGGLFGK